MYVFLNDQFVPEEQATLKITDLAIQRGYGIFDFFKVMDGVALFLDDYLDRFYGSAEVMRLRVPYTRDDLTGILYEIIEKNGLANAGIKMILTGGYSADAYETANPNFIVSEYILSEPPAPVVENGIKIITHEFVRDIPRVKTINYTMGIWLQHRIKEEGAADVLYHWNGTLSEFPRCNLFVVKDGSTVITPATNVLGGITRKNLLRLSGKRFSISEETVTMDDLLNAREAFLTSTTKRIVPIVTVDGRTIGNGKPGEATLTLLEDLKAAEAGYRSHAKLP